MPIPVLIVGAEALFAEALASVLSRDPGIDVVGWCSSIAQVLEVLSCGKIRVILQFQDGVERVLDALRGQGYEGAVIVLTNGLSGRFDPELLAESVSSVFKTSAGVAALLESIRLAALNLKPLDEQGCGGTEAVSAASSGCTDLDRSVKALLLEGFSNKQIGFRLGISEAAVKKHFQRIFRALGVHSRSEVVRILMERRLSTERWARDRSQ